MKIPACVIQITNVQQNLSLNKIYLAMTFVQVPIQTNKEREKTSQTSI